MRIKTDVFIAGMVNTENKYNETVYNACVFADSKSDAKKAIKVALQNDTVFRLEKLKVEIEVSTIYTTVVDEIIAYVERTEDIKVSYSVVDDDDDISVTEIYEHTTDRINKVGE